MALITDSLHEPDYFLCWQINIFTLEAWDTVDAKVQLVWSSVVCLGMFHKTYLNMLEKVVHLCLEVGCCISISSFAPHGQCWSRKAGEMLIVGVFNVKNNRHCKKAGSTVHGCVLQRCRDTLNCSIIKKKKKSSPADDPSNFFFFLCGSSSPLLICKPAWRTLPPTVLDCVQTQTVCLGTEQHH